LHYQRIKPSKTESPRQKKIFFFLFLGLA